jgi:hypothetical protein
MRHLWIKVFVLITWALFVTEVVVFRARHIFLISYVIDIVGIVGFGLTVAWLFLRRRWAHVCVAASTLMVVLYLVRWLFLIQFVHSDASDGLVIDVQRVIQVWGAEFKKDSEEIGLASALLVQYWNALMAFAQILVVGLILMADRSVWRPTGIERTSR